MSDSFTVYWAKPRVIALNKLPEPAPLFKLLLGGPHTSQPSFVHAGVKIGDWLYPIAVIERRLRILGRMQVVDIVQTGSIQSGFINTPVLNKNAQRLIEQSGWPQWSFYKSLCITCTDEAVYGQHGTKPLQHLYLSETAVRNLKYRNQRAERAPKGVENGEVTVSMALQGIYRLTQASANDFAEAVNAHKSQAH
jgi:hypothetical protein